MPKLFYSAGGRLKMSRCPRWRSKIMYNFRRLSNKSPTVFLSSIFHISLLKKNFGFKNLMEKEISKIVTFVIHLKSSGK